MTGTGDAARRPPWQVRLWWIQVLVGIGIGVFAVAYSRVGDGTSAFAVVWSLIGLGHVALGLHNRRQSRRVEAGKADD